jgi:cell division septum initiation protein DivIVA
MAKPIRFVERDIGQTGLSRPIVDQWNVGAYDTKPLTSPQSMPDVPDWARLSDSLLKGYIAIKAESNKDEFEAGKAQAAKDINKGDFRAAVSEGLIPQGADPYFITGYRTVMAQRHQNEAKKLFEQKVKDKTAEYLASQANHTAAQKPPPDYKQLLAETYDFLDQELMQGNPTLANDKYFKSSFADIKLRSLNSMETFGYTYIQDAKEKSMLDQFMLLGKQGLNDVLEGKMTIDDFNTKFITGNVHASNIVDTNKFVSGLVTSWYQYELGKKDANGEPINPDKLQKMYGIIAGIKVGNVRLVENPVFSDDYLRLGGSWVTNKTAKQLSDESWLKYTKNPNSDIHKFVVERDPERKLEQAKNLFLLLETDPEKLGVAEKDVDSFMDKIKEDYSTYTQLRRPLDQSAEIAQVIALAEKGDSKGARLLAGTLQPHSQILARNGIEQAEEGLVKDILSNPSTKALFSSSDKTAREHGIDSLPIYLNSRSTVQEFLITEVSKRVRDSGDSSPEAISKIVQELFPLDKTLESIKAIGEKSNSLRLSLLKDYGVDNTEAISKARIEGVITDSQYQDLVTANNRNVAILNKVRSQSGQNMHRIAKALANDNLYRNPDGSTNTKYATVDLQTGRVYPNMASNSLVNKAARKAFIMLEEDLSNRRIQNVDDLMALEYAYTTKAMEEVLREDGIVHFDAGEYGLTKIWPDNRSSISSSNSKDTDPEVFISMGPPAISDADREIEYNSKADMIARNIPQSLRKGMQYQLRYKLGLMSPEWAISSATDGLDLKEIIPIGKFRVFESKTEFERWFANPNNNNTFLELKKRYGYESSSPATFYIKLLQAYDG